MGEQDSIGVDEIQELVAKVEEFYKERGSEYKLNAIWLANLILKRLRNDLDYYINCEGQKGYGKSNLMLLLSLLQARYAGIYKNKNTGKIVRVLPRTSPLPPEWEMIEFTYNFNKNMSFLDNTADIKIKYNSIDKYMPFVIDEGSKNLHKYQWQNKTQFMLVKLSDTERYQNKSFFVCFPHFSELSPAFRNDRIMMRLYVYARNPHAHYASCIISLKDVNRYITDPWHTEENAKKYEDLMRGKMSILRTPEEILKVEKKLKGYAGNFDIPELKKIAPKIWDRYMRYKISNAQKEIEENEDSDTNKQIAKWKFSTKLLLDYLKHLHPEITNIELAKITGMTTYVIGQIRAMSPPKESVERKVNGMMQRDFYESKEYFSPVPLQETPKPY